MPPKKTTQKQPAKAFVQEAGVAEKVETATAEPAQQIAKQKHTHERTPLNHATDNSLSIDGMTFRRTRSLLDGSSKKTLDIKPDLLNPELSYYWCNDEKGLVDQRVELGYQVVPQLLSKTGEQITTRRRVGTSKDGSPLFAVLMATPKQFKKERQDAQEAHRQSIESGLVAGKTDGKEDLGKGFYTKSNTVID